MRIYDGVSELIRQRLIKGILNGLALTILFVLLIGLILILIRIL